MEHHPYLHPCPMRTLLSRQQQYSCGCSAYWAERRHKRHGPIKPRQLLLVSLSLLRKLKFAMLLRENRWEPIKGITQQNLHIGDACLRVHWESLGSVRFGQEVKSSWRDVIAEVRGLPKIQACSAVLKSEWEKESVFICSFISLLFPATAYYVVFSPIVIFCWLLLA